MWIAENDAALCTLLSKDVESVSNKRISNAFPLVIGVNGDGAKPEPFSIPINRYRRECDMADYGIVDFGEKRHRQISRFAQCFEDLSLVSAAMFGLLKRCSNDRRDRLLIPSLLRLDLHVRRLPLERNVCNFVVSGRAASGKEGAVRGHWSVHGLKSQQTGQ
jgi:hypothetical protein